MPHIKIWKDKNQVLFSGNGAWDCVDRGSWVQCFFVCAFGNVKSGWGNCQKRKNIWVVKKPEKANCIPCSSDPNDKFPITNGSWKCDR